ncbi:hypothetical protein, partial [Lentzea sp.]|uniref:hypothetical protein n=1 Tax=Lentzea sp. TaxID=56099 RepID=UPI002C7D617E
AARHARRVARLPAPLAQRRARARAVALGASFARARSAQAAEEFRERYQVSETVELLVLTAIAGFFLAGLIDNSLIDWTVETTTDHPWLLVFLPLLYVPGFAFYVVSLLWSLLGAAFGFAVPRPLAWSLDREKPGYHVRWFGFFLFVAGFHFDLLAS